MSEYTQQYISRLISQYENKPNASAEVELLASIAERVFEFLGDMPDKYDIDNATGAQLDVIGKWLGQSRKLPKAIPEIRFGFTVTSNSRGFDSKFDGTFEGAPFASKFRADFSDLELADPEYRIYLKLKGAYNNTHSVITEDNDYTKPTLQDAVEIAFGDAWIEDNLNMTLTVYIGSQGEKSRIEPIRALDLIPRPQGVEITDFVEV